MKVLCEGVLWRYHQLKNGEFTVKVRLTRNKEVEYILTGYSSSVENWDELIGSPTINHPSLKS